MPPTRREFLTTLSLTAAASALPRTLFAQSTASSPALPPAATRPDKRFKIAADDLFLLQRQKVKALDIAAKCNLDGVVVDMGSMSGGKALANKLQDASLRTQYLEESKKTGVQIPALAFWALYAWVFANVPTAEDILHEWLTTLTQMNCKIGCMPLMTKDGTMKEPGHADVRKRTVALFKKIAPAAEKANLTLAIESNLDADGYLQFLDEIGSPAFKVFYNPGVALENKYDPYADIRKLGKERIAMLHLEQGAVAPEKFEHLLGDGPIDFARLKDALNDIHWSGWMTIARSRKKGRERKVEENFTANAKFLHDHFPE
ncbi:MAG: TIM barrel protein [Phycisphaerae bacterium]